MVKKTWAAPADLYRVRCLQVHLGRGPLYEGAALCLSVCSPQLLVLTQLVSGVNDEQVRAALASLVLKTQAAGHRHRRHGRHQRGHLAERFGVDGVHVHHVIWAGVQGWCCAVPMWVSQCWISSNIRQTKTYWQHFSFCLLLLSSLGRAESTGQPALFE